MSNFCFRKISTNFISCLLAGSYGSFPNDMQHAGTHPQPFHLRRPHLNLPADVPPPCRSNTDYAQIGDSGQPSTNLVMDWHPPYGSFSHHAQNVGMSAQPPLKLPSRVMDVHHTGVDLYPRQGC